MHKLQNPWLLISISLIAGSYATESDCASEVVSDVQVDSSCITAPLNEIIENLSDAFEIYANCSETLKSKAVVLIQAEADYMAKFLQSYDLSRIHCFQCDSQGGDDVPVKIEQHFRRVSMRIINELLDEFRNVINARDLPVSDFMCDLLIKDLQRIPDGHIMNPEASNETECEHSADADEDEMEKIVDWALNCDNHMPLMPDQSIESVPSNIQADGSSVYDILDENEHLFYDQDVEDLFYNQDAEHLFYDQGAEHLFYDQDAEHLFYDQDAEHDLLLDDISRCVSEQFLSSFPEHEDIVDNADWQPSSGSSYSSYPPCLDYLWQSPSDTVSWPMQYDSTSTDHIRSTFMPTSLDTVYDMIKPTSASIASTKAEDSIPLSMSVADSYEVMSSSSTSGYIRTVFDDVRDLATMPSETLSETPFTDVEHEYSMPYNQSADSENNAKLIELTRFPDSNPSIKASVITKDKIRPSLSQAVE